jgi:hypothetical protein
MPRSAALGVRITIDICDANALSARQDVADSVKEMIAIVAMGLPASVVGRGLCLGACTSGECGAGSPVGAAARTRKRKGSRAGRPNEKRKSRSVLQD